MNSLKTFLKLLLGKGSTRTYAQFGEDAVVAAMLKKVNTGFYVDVGAYHPTLYSNTYALYRRGWSGIAVDANASMENLFHTFRPRDVFLNAAVGTQEGTLTYYEYADGAYNSLDAAQVEALANKKNVRPVSERSVPVRILNDIVAAHAVSTIHFMNIDVEGMDAAILASYDWKVRPAVLAVEIHGFDPDAPLQSPSYALLREKGYALSALAGLTAIFKDEKPG